MAAGILAGLAGSRRWTLRPFEGLDLRPDPAPDFQLALDPHPSAGPVLVTVEYRVPLSDQDAFREVMTYVARARRRTGADRWGLFQDGANPEMLVETFLVPTWEEYLRQRSERQTVVDRRFIERARAYQVDDGEPHVRRLIFAYE
jgi:hypothetical protein